MKTNLILEKEISLSTINFDQLDPQFRKATRNMILSFEACSQLLDSKGLKNSNQVSLVLGTHFGEVYSSLDFLLTYFETKTPRPILFQNSLHNSTLGFLTIQLGLRGPALTVSDDALTEKSSFDLVDILSEQTPYVLVCFVDSIPEDLFPYYKINFPFIEKFQNKAKAYLFCRSEKQ